MVILGVDPGTAICGYGLIEKEGNHLKRIAFGAILTAPETATALRLQQISHELQAIIEQYRPDVMAVEQLFFNKNVRTALTVGQARGVILLAGAEAGLDIMEYTPLHSENGGGRLRPGREEAGPGDGKALALPEGDPHSRMNAADALAIAIFAHANSYKQYQCSWKKIRNFN